MGAPPHLPASPSAACIKHWKGLPGIPSYAQLLQVQRWSLGCILQALLQAVPQRG